MDIHEDVGEFVNIARFGFGQSELTDVAVDLCFVECCHGSGRWSSCEQCWSDFIHLFVGALSTEQNGDQQREGIAVIQGNRRLGVMLVQPIENHAGPFALVHYALGSTAMIAAPFLG